MTTSRRPEAYPMVRAATVARLATLVIVVVSRVHRVLSAARQRLGGGGVRPFWPRPRIRRPVDVARLLLAAAALAALVLLAVLGPDLLTETARLAPAALTGLPRVVLSIANVVASLAVVGVLLASAVDSLRSRRFAVTSAALAGALGTLAWGVGELVVGVRPGAAAVLLGPPDGSAGCR